MGWIDARGWDPDNGKKLSQLLAEQYPDEAEVRALVESAGISTGFLRSGSTSMFVYWFELAKELNENQLLWSLLDAVIAETPALRNRIRDLDAVAGIVTVAATGDRYQLRMLLPGNRPFINRVDLRDQLKKLIEERYPVFLVRGLERSGKSFSFQLLQQVLPEELPLLSVDISRPATGRTATDLARLLHSRFGFDPPPARPRQTTGTRFATELVMGFGAEYRRVPRGRSILFLDGLNRVDLARDTFALVSQLIADVSSGQLGQLQLVVVGYEEQFDAQFRHSVLTEDVHKITQTDIQRFFQDLAQEAGKAVTDETLLALALKALEEPTIERLADRVRDDAVKMLGRT
jgi:hypothetical protein